MTKKITLIKSLSVIVTLFCAANFGFGQTTLVKEDIAIIGVNTDTQDFTFLLRTDIEAGTTIYFSDNEVNVSGTGLNDVTEGVILFTAASNYSCGTVLGFLANSTEFTSVNGTFDLNVGGDEVLAFQGYNATTYEWTTFLHANIDGTPSGVWPGTYPVGFTAADVVIGNRDNRRYISSNTNPNWSELNDILNYDNNNVYTGVTLSTNSFGCPCRYTTTWTSGGWSPSLPSSNTSAIIDYDYNTFGDGNFNACSLTVNAGATLTVSNNSYVVIGTDVDVDGTIYVDTQGAFVQKDDTGLFNLNGTGTASVHKQTALKNAWYYYTYWSSPVVGETIADAFPNTDGDRRFLFNAANYIDTDGDDIDDNGDDWEYALGGDIMLPGVGYAATSGRFGFYPGNDSADFIGEFNTGDVPVAIINNPLNILYSWNFIGNPYPGALDFDAFYAANSSVIGGAAYFWSQASPPDDANPGNQQNNFSTNDYAIYTVGSGGTAGASGSIPDQYVPSAQGFFVAGIYNGTATFTNAMRKADMTSNTLFFKNTNLKSKNKSTATANRIWVNLTSDNGVFNQILVAYVDGASNGFDGLSYDAPKLPSDVAATLYTTIEDSNKKFAIQGKAANSVNTDEVINLGFKTSIDVPTLYTLSVAKKEGDFLTNNPIYLKDNLTNTLHDLSTCDYTFTSEVGEFNKRFEIVFSNKALATDDFNLDDSALKILQIGDSQVRFKASSNLTIKTVSVFDLLGRQLYALSASHNEETYNLPKLKNVVFIAKVKLSNGSSITKKGILK